jgi:thioredoxin reductase
MSAGSEERVVDYLLIGGGLAAATAALELRNRDTGATILLVGEEEHRPYPGYARKNIYAVRSTATVPMVTVESMSIYRNGMRHSASRYCMG